MGSGLGLTSNAVINVGTLACSTLQTLDEQHIAT